MSISKIALLGTGLMGAPMARRLLAAGLSVTVWNRSRDKAEALVSSGARVAESAAEAAATVKQFKPDSYRLGTLRARCQSRQ